MKMVVPTSDAQRKKNKSRHCTQQSPFASIHKVGNLKIFPTIAIDFSKENQPQSPDRKGGIRALFSSAYRLFGMPRYSYSSLRYSPLPLKAENKSLK
ncbi:hypothetical protein AVEN_266924-1 [Araneus ventricosus]|uniref:Uncharacterized protein n=1 Tax=Araneus ventricosus TaxID=182803 RepID=A0A4Y2DBX7_ARAVE|nr:hypothetical protein AVEN_123997-1 [Araneus ventricosus]GBM15037.1 hypothetical protein AVEN_266924-1 [Araneus ventricosus]